MDKTQHFTHLLQDNKINSFLSWAIVIVLIIVAIINFSEGRYTWTVLTIFTIIVIILPALHFRNPKVMPTWYLLFLVILPLIASTTASYLFLVRIPVYISIATISLLLVAEINWFTSVKMNPKYAILLVLITTLAVTGLWHLMRWLLDISLGTSFILDGRGEDILNAEVMHEFIYSTIAGLISGLIFAWYFKKERLEKTNNIIFPEKIPTTYSEKSFSKPPNFMLKLFGVSPSKQAALTYFMQICLVGLLIIGVFSRNLHVILNAILALFITFIPALMKKRFDLNLMPSLVLWITLAVFLDAIGTTFGFYETIDRWDNLTHAVSGSVVAAAGYVIVRVIDIYDNEVHLPPRLMFIFIFLFILAVGVIWEILEYVTDVFAIWVGIDVFLVQYGIHDTMGDMFFNLVGAFVVATWGTLYLNKISFKIVEALQQRKLDK